jgi:hypothetical protein
MWVTLVAPVLVLAIVSLIAALRRPPRWPGYDPIGLRSVVEWVDAPVIAGEIAGDSHEQLRQLVGALAERHYILSSTIDTRDQGGEGPSAIVDVRERRYRLRARIWRGRWLLWVNERGQAPIDTDDLRMLLSGLHRVLENRGADSVAWYRRERFTAGDKSATPFFAD